MSDNPAVEPADIFYANDTVTEEPTKPTEVADVTKQEQEPGQDAEILEKPEEETEQSDSKSEELESKDEEQESLFIELDGEEIDLEDVKKWRDGHLMQSDYTKKTTKLADERKTFDTERESERENLNQDRAKVSEMTDMLSVLVEEDAAIDWAELKEDDPDRYIELKEKADNRKAALEKVKAERETPLDDPAVIAEEQGKLFAANPDWFDDDKKPTKAYDEDINLMNKYAVESGFTNEEISQLTRAHYITTMLKAAKFDALQVKGREIKATREKVPVVSKPKASKKAAASKPMADVFYGDKAG